MLVNYESLTEKNRLYAFTCYVRDWKKQNPETIKRDGDVFSYRTKRGVEKRFAVANDKNYSLKVQGFYFKEIKEDAPC